MVVVHIISDSLGNTAKEVVQAAVAQFDYAKPNYKILKNSNVRSQDMINNIFEHIEDNDVVVQTLVDENLSKYVAKKCNDRNIDTIDLFTNFLTTFKNKFQVEPEKNPGLIRKMGKEYFKRVEALEFAVKYDDGKDVNGLYEADIVILGVSRTSKTPLSLYLANMNLKVMNIPIVKDIILPEELYKIDKRKIIGLTNSVEKLNKLREERLKSLGVDYGSSYTDELHIFEELEYALAIMEKVGCPIIDVENKAIEETADLIIAVMKKRGLNI